MYIDYSVTIDITKISLITIFTVWLNFRLVRVSQYLQRFNLNIRHKSKKRNIISDTLSRLASTNEGLSQLPKHYAKLDVLYIDIYVYTITLVEMSEDFKARIVEEYKSDTFWIKILAILNREEFYSDANAVKLSFILKKSTTVSAIQTATEASAVENSDRQSISTIQTVEDLRRLSTSQ